MSPARTGQRFTDLTKEEQEVWKETTWISMNVFVTRRKPVSIQVESVIPFAVKKRGKSPRGGR